jgi:hypothetical protein
MQVFRYFVLLRAARNDYRERLAALSIVSSAAPEFALVDAALCCLATHCALR